MPRLPIAAGVLAAFALIAAAPAHAATKTAAHRPAKKASEPTPEPLPATNDNLNEGQLTMADRVLTGPANCEFKQVVSIEKIEGHNGNFKLTFDRHSYVMVPEETTTGAIRLVDVAGAVVWVQIPVKSMLMNQKLHQRLVDNCQADEQRIAQQSAQQAAANAPFLAPSAATPASVAAVAGQTLPASQATALVTPPSTPAPAVPASGATVTTTTVTTTTTTKVVPGELVKPPAP